MQDFYIETPLNDVLKAEPKGSPLAITAWVAAQMADRIITALRVQDRNSAEATIYEIADALMAQATAVDPTLIEAVETSGDLTGPERQSLYSRLETPERRVLIRLLQDRPMPRVRDLQATFDYLIGLGLLTAPAKLTERGVQIAEGVLRHWPKGKEV